MILRVWRGWTTAENADAYEDLIRTTIFPGILARSISGLEGVELFRRPIEAEVEFMTLMRFTSWDAVKAFAGQTGRCRSCRRRRARFLPALMRRPRIASCGSHNQERVSAADVGEGHSETSCQRSPGQGLQGVEKNRPVLFVDECVGKPVAEIVHKRRATIEKHGAFSLRGSRTA